MTCRQLADLVTDYLDDALPPDGRESFERHLVECPPCVVHLEQIRTTIRVTRTIEPADIDPEVRVRLMEMFRDWRP